MEQECKEREGGEKERIVQGQQVPLLGDLLRLLYLLADKKTTRFF